MRKKAKDVQKSFVENSEMLSLGKFIRRFKGEEKDESKRVLEVFKEHNEQMVRLSEKNILTSTTKRYWTCYNHVEQVKEIFNAEDFPLKDIDHQLITKLKEPKQNP